jgi:hypothetical protein
MTPLELAVALGWIVLGGLLAIYAALAIQERREQDALRVINVTNDLGTLRGPSVEPLTPEGLEALGRAVQAAAEGVARLEVTITGAADDGLDEYLDRVETALEAYYAETYDPDR